MPLDFIQLIFAKMFEIYSQQIPVMIGLAAFFTLLAVFESQSSSPGKVWWRNPGLITDVTYAMIHGLAGPYFKIPVLMVMVALLSGVMSKPEIEDYFAHGRGPLAGLPFWGQAAIYVIGSDFLLYWIHRIFHGAAMWRFHAIHHSAGQVDWTTTYRFHPINVMLQPSLVTVVMITLGISPQVMAFFVAFDIVSAALVHANVNWTLGPLKYVIAGPVFHRWHHTAPDEGGSSNFAPTFALWDFLFGTFYLPEGKLPREFGVDDQHFPEGYFNQLVYPFQKPLGETVTAVPAQA